MPTMSIVNLPSIAEIGVDFCAIANPHGYVGSAPDLELPVTFDHVAEAHDRLSWVIKADRESLLS